MSRDDEKTESMNDTLNSDEEENEPLLASYESSLTSSPSPSPEQSESESESEPQDPKSTHKPPVSRVKRTSLFVFFAVLCWFAYSNVVHNPKRRNSKVVHASRYSKDYKFRPAASPVITETLKDGRTRLRGALPDPTPQTVLPPVAKKKKRPKKGKGSGKRRKV